MVSSNPDNFLEVNSPWPWDMQSFCRRIIESRQPLYVDNAISDEHWQGAPAVDRGPVRSYFGLPIFWPDNTPFGTICLIDTKATAYSSVLFNLLEQFRDLISADLQLLQHVEDIQTLALTDDLTQCYNRRGLMTLGDQRIKDARRFGQGIGIIYFDVDNLKRVNDEYGHKIGDKAIGLLSRLLRENTRDADVVARIGGDEFVVMLLTASPNYMEAFCTLIEDQYAIEVTGETGLSKTGVSYGFELFSADTSLSLADMIDQTDRLMYHHKTSKI